MVVPWERDPEFLRTSDWTIQSGGPTTYNPPRPIGPNGDAQDVTSFHPGQWNWSPQNMPNILYVYTSPQRRKDFYDGCHPKTAEEKLDAQGNVMFEEWPVPGSQPRKLLNYRHLPDRIGTREWWFVLEAWRRYDPRITWDDIHMRQCGRTRPIANTTQQLVRRNRLTAHMISWDEFGGAPAAKDAQGYPLPSNTNRVATWITDGKKRRNTTRGYTPGLRSPRLGDIPGNRVPWPLASSQSGRHRGTTRGRGTRGSTRGASRGSGAGSHPTALPRQPSNRSSGSRNTTVSQDDQQTESQGDTTDADDEPPDSFEYYEEDQETIPEETFGGYTTTLGSRPSQTQSTNNNAIFTTMAASSSEVRNLSTNPLPALASQAPVIFGSGASIRTFDDSNIFDDRSTGTIGQLPPTHSGDQQTPAQIQPTYPAAATEPLLERVAAHLWVFYNSESLNNPPPHGHGSVNPAHQSAFVEDEIRLSRRNTNNNQLDPSGQQYPLDLFEWTPEDHERARRRYHGDS